MGMFLRRGPAPNITRMSDLTIGKIIKLNINGTPFDWLVVHQGLPSVGIYDASCDGTWLLMKDVYESKVWDASSSNKYESSDINTYLSSTRFLNLFDQNIQNVIKLVKIPYRKDGGSNDTDQIGTNGLPVKAFLLSGYEVGFTTSDSSSLPVDGAYLNYFTESYGVTTKRIAYMNGSAAKWWLRSPYKGNTSSVWYVTKSGRNSRTITTNSYGLRPAIILPSNMIVTDDILPPKMKTVSITGSSDFGYGYVMIGDTKYTKAALSTADTGTTVVAHVGAPDSTGVAGCKIYFNGELVKTGNSSYSFILEGDIVITFKRPDNSTSAVECYIVTQ